MEELLRDYHHKHIFSETRVGISDWVISRTIWNPWLKKRFKHVIKLSERSPTAPFGTSKRARFLVSKEHMDARGKASILERKARDYMVDELRKSLKSKDEWRAFAPNVAGLYEQPVFSPRHLINILTGRCVPSSPWDFGTLKWDPDSIHPERYKFELRKLDKFIRDEDSRSFFLLGEGAEEKRNLILNWLCRQADPMHRPIFVNCASASTYDALLKRLAEACTSSSELPPTIAARRTLVCDYLTKNRAVLILEDFDVYSGLNVASYSVVRNDNVADLVLQLLHLESQSKVILCSPSVQRDLRPYVERDAAHRCFVHDRRLAQAGRMVQDYTEKWASPVNEAILAAYNGLAQSMETRSIPPTHQHCSLVIFATFAERGRESPVKKVARALGRRSLGALVHQMLEVLDQESRILLAFLAVIEDGIEDGTLDRIIGIMMSDCQLLPASDRKASQIKADFERRFSPILHPHDAPDGSARLFDISARLRRAILTQWEKSIVMAIASTDAQWSQDSRRTQGISPGFYSFKTKRRIHSLVARIALEEVRKDSLNTRRAVQTISHLFLAIDPASLKNWRGRELTADQAGIVQTKILNAVADDAEKLDCALNLLRPLTSTRRIEANSDQYLSSSVRLDLWQQLFHIGRSFPAADSPLSNRPPTFPARLELHAGNAIVSASRPLPHSLRRFEVQVWSELAEAAFRSHNLILANSAVQGALSLSSWSSDAGPTVRSASLQLDILVAQGELRTADQLCRAAMTRAQVFVDEAIIARRSPLNDKSWAFLNGYVRLVCRRAYIQLLRDDARSVFETFQDLNNLLSGKREIATTLEAGRIASSFRLCETPEGRLFLPINLGAHVLLRAALRTECIKDWRTGGDWLKTLGAMADAALPGRLEVTNSGHPMREHDSDALLDGYCRARWDHKEERWEIVKTAIESLGRMIDAAAWAGAVGPVARMRQVLEGARNAFFLYCRDPAGRNPRYLEEGLRHLQRVIELARVRRYPLFWVDALLMSAAAKKELDSRHKKSEFGSSVEEDLGLAHEMMNQTSYRLRWPEFDRIAHRKDFSDEDAQAWG